jgi:Zn-dependent peptidase ImmA (M78 family)
MGISLDLVELADIAKPIPLAKEIFRQNPNLSLPVPLEDLAKAAGIVDINALTTDGFEGMLIANAEKSEGVILVKQQPRRQRRRFTIGHELGHFLLPWHRKKSGESQQFMCSQADMSVSTAKASDLRLNWEVQANEFASELLMPTTLFKAKLNAGGEPDLKHLPDLSTTFDTSMEATVRRYVDLHDFPIAVVFVHNGTIRYSRKGSEFRHFLDAKKGAPAPRGSTCHADSPPDSVSEVTSVDCALWLDEERGAAHPHELLEQTLHQQDGYKIVLLHACGDLEDD